MRINSVTNCLLFSIKIVGLINECTSEFWCSQIHRLVGVQFYKLIVNELLGTSLRFFTNITYVAFQICRFSLIGQEHGSLVEKVSKKMSLKRLLVYFACLSFALSIVKYFRYEINDENQYRYLPNRPIQLEPLDEYPARFSSVDSKNNGFDDKYKYLRNEKSFLESILNLQVGSGTMAFLIINIISDILNYLVFFIVILVLDIVTCVELRKTLSQKIATTKKVEEEKEEAIFKSTLLIVLNALCNFILKFPMILNSIFEIIVSLNYMGQESFSYENLNYFLYFLEDLKGGVFFENLCNFLYYLSLSLNFVFYYNFDRMFRFNFRKWYFKEVTTAVSPTMLPQRPHPTN
jgi:hypothetical protein